MAEALRRVQQQVRALGGTDLRVDTAHRAEDYRLDGQLRANARVPEDPGVVVRFRVHGQPREMAMDPYRRIEDNLAAVAAVIDAKRTAIRHGGATAEREFQGYAALPSGDPDMDGRVAQIYHMHPPKRRPAHEVLGVAEGAPPEVARAAYKALILKHHPDREGGDADTFREIQDAWERINSEVRTQ